MKKNYELVGIEVPIFMNIQEGVQLKSFLDVVLRNKISGRITIIDLKTATRGWTNYQKKDFYKKSQLLMYKQFYSEQYNHPVDKIEVEYFIVKRKLWENTDFPQKRVQKFVPASGKPSMNKVNTRLLNFVDNAFTEQGEHKNDMKATPSKKACKWCEFRKTEYCSEGV